MLRRPYRGPCSSPTARAACAADAACKAFLVFSFSTKTANYDEKKAYTLGISRALRYRPALTSLTDLARPTATSLRAVAAALSLTVVTSSKLVNIIIVRPAKRLETVRAVRRGAAARTVRRVPPVPCARAGVGLWVIRRGVGVP